MDCGMVNDIFGSVANIGAMITDTITQMQNALSDVLSTIGDIFTAGMTAISGAVLSAINAASAAISSALSTVGSLISDAMTGLQDMINTEKEKLAALMNEMLGFGFLKSLPSLDICGQDLMSGILDSSKISTGVLGSL
jgi:phage-related protein